MTASPTKLQTTIAGLLLLLLGVTGCTASSKGSQNSENLNLPKIPWEGGPAYWKKFAKTDAAGWDDPSFFPIAIWFNGISNDAEVSYDKEHGINTYMGMADTTPYSLFEENDVFWIGGGLNDSFSPQSRNWVGTFLDDEVDGRFTPEEGWMHLQKAVNTTPAGYFKYANFTQSVISDYMRKEVAQKFINGYTDAVSVDMYWYTIPYCDQRPYINAQVAPVSESNCRTSSSYGRTMEGLRQQDASDGQLQPLWQFIENLNGGPGEGPFNSNILPAQLQGAVMSSLINEARGIVYFNQSLSGPCQGGSILRQSQVVAGFCGNQQMSAMKEINSRIHALAPVLNSQSYQVSLGKGLDTMVKSHEGYGYIFAMIDHTSQPGYRDFHLPDGITANRIDVLYENRDISIDSNNKFSDNFDAEYSYHIYRVKL